MRTEDQPFTGVRGTSAPLEELIQTNPVINDVVVGAMLSTVGGIMVFISFDELLPTAREYARGHTAIVGVVLGMAIMAVSLLLL